MLNKSTWEYIQLHREEDVKRLALQKRKEVGVDYALAFQQIQGYQLAKRKLPTWHSKEGLLYPPRLSMEQCSSEQTAQYKAQWMQGRTLVDLTGGYGVDCSYISPRFAEVHYVEQQEMLCQIAQHNFPLLGLSHIKVHHADAVEYLNSMEERVDWIFLDPARRNEQGGKVVALADCMPDVEVLEERLVHQAERVMVKLSPMLDIYQLLRTLKHVEKLHIVAVGGECKELLVVLNGSVSTDPMAVQIIATQLHTDGTASSDTFTFREERDAPLHLAERVGKYLYEPHSALLKGGMYRLLSDRYGVQKLHPYSHLYTADGLLPFPGRQFVVEEVFSFNKKQLKTFLADIFQANLTVRNFPTSVEELRRQLKLKEGGSVYLFATTVSTEQHVIIRCRKP